MYTLHPTCISPRFVSLCRKSVRVAAAVCAAVFCRGFLPRFFCRGSRQKGYSNFEVVTVRPCSHAQKGNVLCGNHPVPGGFSTIVMGGLEEEIPKKVRERNK